MKKQHKIRLSAVLLLSAALALGLSAGAAAKTQQNPNGVSKVNQSLKIKGLDVTCDINNNAMISWTNKLTGTQEITLEYSQDPDFKEATEIWRQWFDKEGAEEAGNSFYLRGEGTIYVRGYIYDSAKTPVYGPYSFLNCAVKPGRLEDYQVSSEVGKTSVTLRFDDIKGMGYEIYRAKGSGSYKLVAKTNSDTFKDTGLSPNTEYSYKIRAYVYNPYDKKTTYGPYTYRDCTTWGSSLSLRAVAAGKDRIKLTWKKVKDASGYHIYRADIKNSPVGYFAHHTYDSSFGNYKKRELIATVKAGAASYTDKGLDNGADYVYYVEAYRTTKSGKKALTYMVSDSDTASLAAGGFNLKQLSQEKKADGRVTVTWSKAIGAKGYKIVKVDYNTDDSRETPVVTLKANQTSYTFKPGAQASTYYVYAYKTVNKKEVLSDPLYVPVDAKSVYAKAPANVKAVPAEGNTAVKISWRKVTGASAYRVYRSRAMLYDETHSTTVVPSFGSDQVATNLNGGVTSDFPASVTSIVDRPDKSFSYNGGTYKGPQQGFYYYYYVTAVFKENDNTMESRAAAPARIILDTTKVSKPSIQSVSAGKQSATVKWKKVKGASAYAVYYSTSKKGDYTFSGRTSKTSLKVKSLKSGKKYYFKVRAIAANAARADVLSKLSAAKSVTVK